MARNKRLLGTEVLTFTDGTTKEVNFHSVSSYDIGKLRKMYREVKLDSKGKVLKSDFDDTEFAVAVLSRGVGTQISREDIQEIEGENILKELYDKYYGKLSDEKKDKLTDTSDSKKETQSQE